MKKADRILFILMGFLSLSSFSSWVLIDNYSFPFALPELFFIPFGIYFRNRVSFFFLRSSGFLLSSIVFVLLILIAVMWDDYSIAEILGASRSYFYMNLFYFMFRDKVNLSIDELTLICFGSIVGWAVTAYFNLNAMITTMLSSEQKVTYGAMLAISLFIFGSLYKKKYLLFSVGMSAILFISFTAGLRRQMFVTLLSLALYAFFSFTQSRKIIFINVFLGASLIFSTMLFMPFFEDHLKNNAPQLYKRVFTRTETLIQEDGFDTDSEQTRLNNFQFLLDKFEYFQVPRGFVSKSSSKAAGSIIEKLGRYNDFPLLEVSHVFGFFPFMILLFIFISQATSNFNQLIRYKRTENIMYLSAFVVMVFLLFLEGTFINYTYAVPFTGLCLGRLKYYSQKNALYES